MLLTFLFTFKELRGVSMWDFAKSSASCAPNIASPKQARVKDMNPTRP